MKKGGKKYKLRGGLDPSPPEEAGSNEAMYEYLEQKRKELRKKLCSEYWVDEVLRKDSYVPDAKCNCAKCKARGNWGWPRNYILSCGLSYDCWCDLVYGRQYAERKQDRYIGIRREEAASLGLYPKRERSTGPSLLVTGCERCESLRRKGDKYCLQCNWIVQQEMRGLN